MKMLFLVVLASLALISGCAHNLSATSLAQADRSISFADLRANPEAYRGKFVILGGVVADMNPTLQGMQLEIVQYNLDGRETPDEASGSNGRFQAVVPESLVTPMCKSGMLVSLAGEVVGRNVQVMQGKEYVYPLIAVKELRIISVADESTFRSWVPNAQ
jgi:outer membrane lipoprotein